MAIDRPRLHCHSAFKHYQMYHRDCGSDYGNSVFNYTYNINGGNICGGGFWGGLWGGIGYGIGNFLGGLFGGGFGFNNWFGGNFNLSPYNMMTTTPFSLYGNSYLFNPANFWSVNSNNNDDNNSKKAAKKQKPEAEDADAALNKNQNTETPSEKEIKDIDGLLDELENNPDAELDEDKIKALIENETDLDKLEKLQKKYGDKLSDSLKNALNTKIDKLKGIADNEEDDGSDIELEPEDTDINSAIEITEWNTVNGPLNFSCPEGYSWVGDKDITNMPLALARDGSKETKDVVPANGDYKYSNEKFGDTNYPLYMTIRTEKDNLYRYKCVKANERTAVYTTPKSDINHNVYCVVVKDSQIYLYQTESLGKENGYTKPDTQADKRDTTG